MSLPITLICGFGRCGSSLTMQMLAAGGMRCAGEPPSYEPDELQHRAMMGNVIAPAWLDQQRGGAIKLLDPHRYHLPRGHYLAIWLRRNGREQAKSQCKFATMLMGLPTNRRTVREFEQSYIVDKPHAIATLRRAGAEIIEIEFEALIGSPAEAAEDIARFLGIPLDIDRMVAAVLPRSPECQPDLAIELSLMARADRSASPAPAAPGTDAEDR